MRTFSVKNFERFQHYKDRAPPWIKLYNELLENYEFGILPDRLKGQLIGIWLLASRMDNKLPFDAKWLAKKINATDPIDLDLLLDTGFIEPYDEDKAVGKREDWPSRYIPDAVRTEVMQRDGNKCIRCSSPDRLEIDHIQPISQGGTGEKENLQVLCVSCNRKKRAEQLRSKVNAEPTQMRSLERETEKRRERDRGEEIAASPPRKKSKRSLPEAFQLSEANASYAKSLGFSDFEIRREHQKFCMHAKAKDVSWVDWNAAEHNWITKAAEFAGKRPRGEVDIADDGLIEVLDQLQLEAWDAYGRTQTGKPYPRNKKGGWRHPSKWPPGHETKVFEGVQKLVAAQTQ